VLRKHHGFARVTVSTATEYSAGTGLEKAALADSKAMQDDGCERLRYFPEAETEEGEGIQDQYRIRGQQADVLQA
jgi:hypothetical protein